MAGLAVIETEAIVELVPPPAPVLPTAAIALLPGDETIDPYWRVAGAFLVGYSADHSARTYYADPKARWAWCASLGVHPFACTAIT